MVTVLDRLGDNGGARVFDIEKRLDGTFRLIEACDQYFYLDLTPAELAQLGKELIALAEGADHGICKEA